MSVEAFSYDEYTLYAHGQADTTSAVRSTRSPKKAKQATAKTPKVLATKIAPKPEFGSATDLPNFIYPIGSKVRIGDEGKYDWTVFRHGETPSGTFPRSYQIGYRDEKRVASELALRPVPVALPAPAPIVAPVIVPLAFGPGTSVTFAEWLVSSKARLPRAAATRATPSARAPAPRLNAPFRDDQIVTILVENPRKPGSKTYDRWFAYANGRTVAATIAAGALMADLKWDAARSNIAIA